MSLSVMCKRFGDHLLGLFCCQYKNNRGLRKLPSNKIQYEFFLGEFKLLKRDLINPLGSDLL